MMSSEGESERRASVSGDGAKHKIGYNSRWEADHTVFYVEDKGMYCELFQKFNTNNHQNQSKVWNVKPCTTFGMDILARHEASAMHKVAVEQEKVVVEQERACPIVKACHVALQRNAMIGAMECLYWLCKQEIAHTTNYEPLLS